MNKITFGFIGTFGKWHGVQVLEKLIPAVVACESLTHFLLMGEGDAQEVLKQAFCEQGLINQVTFTGKIFPHQVPTYLAQCDVFLCPTQPNADGSRFFGSPTKLFEYLSMGRPVIASNLEQVAEIVSPAFQVKDLYSNQSVTDQIGVIVDPLDVQGFIDACLFFTHMSESDRKKMGMNARKKAIDQYTWQAHVKKIIEHAQL